MSAEVERENKILRKKLEAVERMPFCPDHRDKLHGKPCRECEVERLNRLCDEIATTAKNRLAEVERLRSRTPETEPIAWRVEWHDGTQWRHWLTDYVEKGWEPPTPYTDLKYIPLVATQDPNAGEGRMLKWVKMLFRPDTRYDWIREAATVAPTETVEQEIPKCPWCGETIPVGRHVGDCPERPETVEHEPRNDPEAFRSAFEDVRKG